MWGTTTLWLAATVLTTATAQLEDAATPARDPQPALGLQELVEAFFLSDNAVVREGLSRRIEKTADGSIQAAARAIESAGLWSPIADKCGTFQIESGGGAVEVSYRLPADYDPAVSHPLIIDMPDVEYPRGKVLDYLLQDADDRFVAIHPARPIDGSFHRKAPAGVDLPTLLWHVKRRMHIDSDGVFVTGIGTGADAAWMGAIMHPDLLAGAIILVGYPPVPYPEQVYPFLLENIRHLPVLIACGESFPSTPTPRIHTVDQHNRALLEVAHRKQLPITCVGHCGGSSDLRRPSKPPLPTFLEGRRARPPRHVSHWFRYPNQGRAGWLRQTRLKDEVWVAEQLSILPSPATDHDQYITDTIKSKLAYLGGHFDGQTITIETQRCGRIEILLTEDLVDLSRPVTVRCNGRERHQGPLRRSIRILLTTAYETWDFQRLVVARLSLDIKADGNPP